MLSIYHFIFLISMDCMTNIKPCQCYNLLIPEKEDSAGEARGANPFSFFPYINLKYV